MHEVDWKTKLELGDCASRTWCKDNAVVADYGITCVSVTKPTSVRQLVSN